MKLVMTLLVQDESDIIASNIDFHLAQGVDFIIAMDNSSTDGTQDILRGYERQGVLHYIDQPERKYFQSRWVTQMARMAAADFGADWVINNDADEFWWPIEGNLKELLSQTDGSCDAVRAERSNFIPPVSSGFFADTMTLRERNSLNVVGAPLPGKVCHRAFPDIVVPRGNHKAERHDLPLPVAAAPILVFHFPVRSYEQLLLKIVKTASDYDPDGPLPDTVCVTWRRLDEVWRRGELNAYYQSLILDAAAVESGLKSGSLIAEERLKNFLAQLPAHGFATR